MAKNEITLHWIQNKRSYWEVVLERCAFPVGASLLREKLQVTFEQIEDAILNTQEDKG